MTLYMVMGIEITYQKVFCKKKIQDYFMAFINHVYQAHFHFQILPKLDSWLLEFFFDLFVKVYLYLLVLNEYKISSNRVCGLFFSIVIRQLFSSKRFIYSFVSTNPHTLQAQHLHTHTYHLFVIPGVINQFSL